MVKYGIIGCGNITLSRHLPTLKKMENVEVTALCDVDEKAVKKAGEKFRVKKCFQDYREMLKEPLDVVLIALPTPLHAKVGVEVAEAGKHIYVEKPMALNLKEAKMMEEAVKRNKVKICIGHTQRFMSVSKRVKEIILKGEVGEIFKVKGSICNKVDWGKHKGSKWRRDPKSIGSGPLMDLGCHLIDTFLHYLEDRVERVYGEEGKFLHKERISEDNFLLIMRFKKGAIGVIELSESQHFQDTTVEIDGIEGSIRYLIWGQEINIYHKGKEEKIKLEEINDAPYDLHSEFLKSIIEDKPSPVPLEEGMEVVRVVEAGYISAREKREVFL
ncbi:Gfo/Idh/MocA family oxidoreductase [Candidatus Calescamantes bacterium]|nr:Gfo/Idh/MocA family oxidoreductase [Candidatus Calescamantes bacterium]